MFSSSLLLIATMTSSSNSLYDMSLLADCGTIAAGFTAAIALAIDAYSRLFGKQPRFYLSIRNHYQKGKEFQLRLVNYGEAPGEILSVKADPIWNDLGIDDHVSPLLPFLNYTADQTDSLDIPLSTGKIATILRQYYSHEENFDKPLILRVQLEYKSHALCPPFKKRKTTEFRINLLSDYIDVFPLHTIIDTDKIESFCKIYASQLEEFEPSISLSIDDHK